jgi:hypothetical protein
LEPSTGAAVRDHRIAVRNRPDSLSAFAGIRIVTIVDASCHADQMRRGALVGEVRGVLDQEDGAFPRIISRRAAAPPEAANDSSIEICVAGARVRIRGAPDAKTLTLVLKAQGAEGVAVNGVNSHAWLTGILIKLVNRWPASRINELMPYADIGMSCP